MEEVFILARGESQATVPAISELVVGFAMSLVAVVIAAIVIISVVICIACVYYKKRVRKIEMELREVHMVQLNLSYGQATQLSPLYEQINPIGLSPSRIVGTDSSLDGQYATVKDTKVVV